MKKTILFFIFCIAEVLSLQAQTENILVPSNESSKTNDSSYIYAVAEQMPEFPGGDEGLNEYLNKNLVYPEQAKKDSIQGKVWIEFIVDKEGKASQSKILRGIGGGCDEEAIRVVENMPKWKPAMLNGKPVNLKFRFPIKFVLK